MIFLYNNLHALPITDGVPGVYKALWKKSAGMPCHQVCRPYRDEFARIFHAPTKTRMTFDCKAFVKKLDTAIKNIVVGYLLTIFMADIKITVLSLLQI